MFLLVSDIVQRFTLSLPPHFYPPPDNVVKTASIFREAPPHKLVITER